MKLNIFIFRGVSLAPEIDDLFESEDQLST